jgi:transposase-like protein
VLDDLIRRGLRRPEFLIVDGAPGLGAAVAAVWDGVPVQRCTVHKHRNLLAHAPERLHEEITADYNDMIYAATREEIEARRKAFIRKWRLKHRAVADSLQEAGDRLFSFTRLPPSQWKSARTTDEIDKRFLRGRVRTHRPARTFVLPVPLSRMVAPYAAILEIAAGHRHRDLHTGYQRGGGAEP